MSDKTTTDLYSEENLAKKSRLSREHLNQAGKILSYIKPYRAIFGSGLFLLVFSSFLTLLLPLGLKYLLQSAEPGGAQLNMSEFLPGSEAIYAFTTNEVLFGLFILLIVQSVFSFLRVYTFAHVSQNVMADIRGDLYTQMISLGIPFFEKHRVGELHSRITADVEKLESMLSFTFAEFLRQFSTLVIGIPIIFIFAPKLTLFMLAVFPVLILGAVFFGRFIRKLSRETQDSLANSNILVEQALQTIQTVKAFTNEFFEILRYKKSLAEVVRLAMKNAVNRGAFISFIITGIMGAVILVIWYGVLMASDGSNTFDKDDLFAFVLFTAFIAGAIGGLPNTYGEVQKALGASERLQAILKEEQELEPIPSEDITGPEVVGDIEFSDIKFSYPTRKDVTVLKGISLKAKAGQKIALAGPSGAGKSTIVQLLMRFYDPDSGILKVDGKPLPEFDIRHLRKHVGIVPQEVILLGGSIRENIAYGRPNATDQEIKDAADKANALEFIENFPEGFETLVGDRGVKLSGGQRQRVAIARAILKDPEILILDEATSSLDAESEKLVQDALNLLMENRTTIIIAHRLATIRNVDRIYVIDDGKIRESGTHDELSSNDNGLYSNLVKLQFQS